MRGLSHITLVGNLGQDPDLRYLQSGDPVVNFSLAVNRRTRKDGEWVEVTDWYRCSLFGKQAESFDSMATKGSAVLVQGEPSQRTYTGNDGVERSSFEVRVFTFLMVGGRQQDADDSGRPPARQSSGDDFADFDDVPFD